MTMSVAERENLIERYAAGADLLKDTLARVPERARRWRPAPDEFSVHDVVCHVADVDAVNYVRLRYLVGTPGATIVGFDEMGWARAINYDEQPFGAALATVLATRANTAPLLRRIPEEIWTREGNHTEYGGFSTEACLQRATVHMEDHVRQIEAILAAWQQSGGE